MRVAISTCVLIAVSLITPSGAAYADDGDSDGATANLYRAEVEKEGSGEKKKVPGSVKRARTESRKVQYEPYCANKLIDRCGRPVECTTVAGSPGFLYDLKIDGKMADRGACVAPAQARSDGTVTPGDVLTAFRRLHWPPSALTVQPPGGKTLVNFKTNFYTDDTAA
ncbi:MAG: hypothetical protein L0H31_05350, partial [Nocardioidaceae bacterium]|nr:hypothetical protein [Nocardioidaceae bacterium]